MAGDDVALVCFPHAGGSSATYNAWRRLAPAGIRVVTPACYGGRTSVRGSMEGMIEAVVEEVSALASPVVFYGHSMGATLAYEVALCLQRAGRPVARVYLSGRRAPHMPLRVPPIHHLPIEQVIPRLVAFGGLPATFDAASKVAREVIAHVCDDLRILEAFASSASKPARPAGAVLSAPLVAIHGRDDALVTAEELRAWRGYTHAGFEFHALEGDHFFHCNRPTALIDLIASRLPARSA